MNTVSPPHPKIHKAAGHSAQAIEHAAIALSRTRVCHEVEHLASVYCDHVRGVPVARAAGIDAHHFSEGDLRLLWHACAVCHETGASRETLLRISEQALRSERYWSNVAPLAPPFGPIWCRENLSILAGREFFCRPVIERNARRLLDLCQRQESARQHLADAWAAMTEAGAPASTAAPKTIYVMPPKVRAVA